MHDIETVKATLTIYRTFISLGMSESDAYKLTIAAFKGTK